MPACHELPLPVSQGTYSNQLHYTAKADLRQACMLQSDETCERQLLFKHESRAPNVLGTRLFSGSFVLKMLTAGNDA
jgi:hypothetical protein